MRHHKGLDDDRAISSSDSDEDTVAISSASSDPSVDTDVDSAVEELPQLGPPKDPKQVGRAGAETRCDSLIDTDQSVSPRRTRRKRKI